MIEKSHWLPRASAVTFMTGVIARAVNPLHMSLCMASHMKTCAYLLIDGQDSNKSKRDRKRRQRGQKRFGSWLQKQ